MPRRHPSLLSSAMSLWISEWSKSLQNLCQLVWVLFQSLSWIYFFPSVFHFFPIKDTISPDLFSFCPHAISKFTWTRKRAAAFRVWPHSVKKLGDFPANLIWHGLGPFGQYDTTCNVARFWDSKVFQKWDHFCIFHTGEANSSLHGLPRKISSAHDLVSTKQSSS